MADGHVGSGGERPIILVKSRSRPPVHRTRSVEARAHSAEARHNALPLFTTRFFVLDTRWNRNSVLMWINSAVTVTTTMASEIESLETTSTSLSEDSLNISFEDINYTVRSGVRRGTRLYLYINDTFFDNVISPVANYKFILSWRLRNILIFYRELI